MANADDLRALAEDMANAYEDRVARIKDIKKDTKQTLTAIHADNEAIKDETHKLIQEANKEDKARAADMAKYLSECKEEDKA
ncbi:MAG: hypothetical protein QMC83_01945, partial [Thermodesulfovibrionales bacterium]|nr:hypothetical protein [Thermodesulfovibrionales bacterium]